MNSARALSSLRPLLEVVVVLALASGSMQAEVVKGAASSTPVCAVDLGTTLRDAHRVAAVTGASVVRVEGGSMLPYFGDGSVLVVRASKLESLRAGTVVVYRNHLGESVAHRLETRVEGGWRVRGANNRSLDSTLVTEENFIGSVYATFHSNARGLVAGGELAKLVESTPVVLAASAR
jgi:signal peptidase I